MEHIDDRSSGVYFTDQFIKPAPENLANEKPIFRGIWQGGQTYTIDTVSGKLATQYTPPENKRRSPNSERPFYFVLGGQKRPAGAGANKSERRSAI